MRVDVSPRQIDLTPGSAQTVAITIVNTETIIAGFAVRILGADPSWVEFPGEQLSLFPDETRTVPVVINPPKGLPAGSRRLAVQVRELTPPHRTVISEIDLVVPPMPMTQVRVDPMVVTAGKRATYSILVENVGNTELRGYLAGDDPENQVRFGFTPDAVVLGPGEHHVVEMRASAKRAFFGTPTVRTLSVYLDPARPDEFFTGPETPREEREQAAGATFIQKSVMARGALSLLGLLAAATVFAIVITLALSRLVAQSTADRNLALQVAAAQNSSSTAGSSGLGGTVRQLTTGDPVPGVAVSVFDDSDTSTAVATTATDTKGHYQVGNLAAGSYKISYRGAGFEQVWYPAAADASNATSVQLQNKQLKDGLDVSLGGVPASITGTVNGDDVSAATLFLETLPNGVATASLPQASPLQAPTPTGPPDNGGAVVEQVPIGSDGSFTLDSVPSPSVYDLVVVKQGYATSVQRIDVGAGEARTGVALTLVRGDGVLSGSVRGPSGPLGSVHLTATSGQNSQSTVSLTGSKAGQFTLRSLSTPATYTVVASKSGYASQTLTVSLSSGQQLTGIAITLARSSAVLTGRVQLRPSGNPVGGVAVAVANGRTTVQTVTQSSDDVGAWSVSGLKVPGVYTATFSRADLQTQVVSISLDATGAVTPDSVGAQLVNGGVQVTMTPATASVSGTVYQPEGANVCDSATGALGEASVTLSSGSTSYSVTSASVAPHCGAFRLENIPAGTYTLTATATSGTTPQSQVITLSAGDDLARDIRLSTPASLAGTVSCCTAGSDATAGPRGGWSVFLYQRQDYPDTVYRTTTTGSDGSFAFPAIDAGSYLVAVGPTSNPSNATTTKSVTVQPSQRRTGVTIRVSQ